MMKINIFIFFNCLLFSQLVYSNTEIKPPNGPFISMLRLTFLEDAIGSKTNDAFDTEEIEYKFEVPDLGRYSEKPNDYKLEEFEFLNIKPTLDYEPNGNVEFPPVKKQMPQLNHFDQRPLVNHIKPPPTTSAFSSENRTIPIEVTGQGFDDLPLTAPQNDEQDFYPPEWAQPNPLRPLNRLPQNNSNNSFYNSTSNNSMMGMPFSEQMMPWLSGNQNNNGYR